MASIMPGDAVVRADDQLIGPHWQVFRRPERVLTAMTLDDVSSVVEEAAHRAESGAFVVGFLAYEAAPAFDAALTTKHHQAGPLAWFACYVTGPEVYRVLFPPGAEPTVSLEEPDWDLAAYERAFAEVREGLARGDNYQTNLTFAQRFGLEGSAAALFASRCGVDPPPYATLIHGGDWQIASFSPELLFERAAEHIEMRPMKGTAPIPASVEERQAVAEALRHDPKTIAENIMIVDMVRNDLGAVCEVGSVQTPKLLQVETHRGLFQVTSTVTGQCARPTSDVLRAVFPAASVTGAPKAETMKKIAALESGARGVYCGAIGVMSRGYQRFAVAIRTAWLEGERGVFGVGSGIVWDSSAAAEYAECLLKRDRLLVAAKPFELRESIAAHRLDDVSHVRRHLDRLAHAAEATGFPLDREALEAAVLAFAKGQLNGTALAPTTQLHARSSLEIPPSPERDARAPLEIPPSLEREALWRGGGGRGPETPSKLRIALHPDGTFSLELSPSLLPNRPLRVALASRPVVATDPALRLKTSSRAVLDARRDEFPGHDEVLCFNTEGHLTEFTYGNLAAKIGGRWFTPPPDDGCLNGIEVQERIDAGELAVQHLSLADLGRFEGLAFLNSVVGWLPVISLTTPDRTFEWTAEDSSPRNRQSC